jgi:predicted amidohydrolase YtcJ
MAASRRGVGSHAAAVVVIALVSGCVFAGTSSPESPSCPGAAAPTATAGLAGSDGGDLVIVGRIVTMDDAPVAEALLIEAGVVTCIGTRDEVNRVAGEDVPVVDIGSNVAYPGFIDAHAHWIGDREYYGLASAQEAMDAALRRGWTSISEQWVNPERLDELTTLAAEDALPLRVDAYLALNFGDEFLGDWYTSHEHGPIGDHLRIQGVKIHLDDGSGAIINWEPDDLTESIGRTDDAGWQVSVHTVSTEAMDLVLDAFEAAIGPNGPNPLHHRIEHAIEVSDAQLARMVAMDIATVIHLDGAADWLTYDEFLPRVDRDNPGEEIGWLARWRDFVDAGLHVASATDAPWTFPDFEPGDQLVELSDDVGRPVDQIAAGMDGRRRMSPETPPWLLDQLLTAEQGLRAVTLDAAYALADEGRRGHLAPGALGDATILSGDVLAATPDEIRAMDVVATIVDGVVAYCGAPEVCQVMEPAAWPLQSPSRS